MASLQFQGVHVNVIIGTNPVISNVTERGYHMRYGDFAQGIERSFVDLDINAEIVSQTLNGDGSVTAIIQTKYTNWHRTHQSPGAPDIPLQIHVYNSQERENEARFISDSIGGSSKSYDDLTFSTTITIPPLTTVNIGMGRYWNDIIGYDTDDEWNGGFMVHNPNPPDYRPGSRMVNGIEESCNRSAGWNGRMDAGVDTELRTKNGGTATNDPPSVWQDNEELNQKRIGANG